MTKSEKFHLNIFNGLLFLAYPFLAIPGIIRSLANNSKASVILYSLLVSFISFLFRPTLEMDKSRHMYFYDICKNLPFAGFIQLNFQDSPDFIFRLAMYIAATLSIRVHLIFFVVTFFSVYLVFLVYKKYVDNLNINIGWLVLLLFITSISYIDILSGMRYTLATAFAFYGYHQGMFNNNRKLGMFWLIFAVFTHFSTILFAIAYAAMPLLSKLSFNFLRGCLAFTLLFLIVPQDFILDLFKSIGLGGALNEKVDAYLDVGGEAIQKTFAQNFIDFFNILWVYVLNAYFIFKKRSLSRVSILIISLLIVTNLFISFPIIYNRYALFIKMVLVMYLLNEHIKLENFRLTKIFVSIFVIICINQIIILRPSLIEIFTPGIFNWNLFYQLGENNFNLNDLQ